MKLIKYLPALLCLILNSCGAQKSEMPKTDRSSDTMNETTTNYIVKTIVKTDAQWKSELNDIEYNVLRHEGTERAFSGDLWDNKEKGDYICRGCELPLFNSDTKFKSGTGWPSYYAPIRSEHITEIKDNKFGWNRVEVRCARCDGHLGHVFDDGPDPTGLRFCINSASLDFVPTNN